MGSPASGSRRPSRLIRPYIRRTPVLVSTAPISGWRRCRSPQAGTLSALRVVQGARRVRQPADARRCRRPAWWRRRAAITARPSPTRRERLGRAREDLRAEHLLAGQDRADPPLRRRAGGRRRALCGCARAPARLAGAQSGAMAVHAFDQAETMLGQGTIGLELEQQAELDTLLVAVGGGGLIGGIAAWFANKHPRDRGRARSRADPRMRRWRAGRPVDAQAGGIAADSLAPRRVGEIDVPDRAAIRRPRGAGSRRRHPQGPARLWEVARIVAEPGGAAAFSAALSGRYRPAPGRARRRRGERRQHGRGGFRPIGKHLGNTSDCLSGQLLPDPSRPGLHHPEPRGHRCGRGAATCQMEGSRPHRLA